MSEWSLGMKLGVENNGQQAIWPKAELPDWYRAYTALPQASLVEADWVRQAVSLGIHRDPARLLASVDAMIESVPAMATDFRHDGATDETLSQLQEQLAAIRSVRVKLDAQIKATTADRTACNRLWIEARRQMRRIALANPGFAFDKLVCIKQFTPHTVRNITRSYAWKHKPGGDICVLSNLADGATAEGVLKGRLGPGYVWGLDLWWDGDRVVFGYAKQPNWPPDVDTANYRDEGQNVFNLRKLHEPLHIFEAKLDGSGLKQLTDDPYWSDFEPTYCADGRIAFSSDRCARAAECGNTTYDHTNPNLYIMAADGSDVRHLTDNKDIDRYPHSLDDGRIAYTHWEYQERHFMEVHAIWSVRPDGTMSDTLFKHHMRAPCGMRDTRSIPKVSIATGHHTFAYGPVVVVDTGGGLNRESGISIVTPGVRPQEGKMAGTPVPEGGVLDKGGLYHAPWALGEKCFLASYAYARPGCTQSAGVDSNGFGVYLIDSYGNRELIHRDPLHSSVFPMPLAQRRRPPVLPNLVKNPESHATCYVTDVYDGMEDVPRGTIKYIRIAQHVGWPFDPERGQMDYIHGTAGDRRHLEFRSWSPVRVIGEVPVAADGSASFTVPADTAIYFQALDKQHMEVVRMRSMASFKQGEVRGCRGCHHTQAKAPASVIESGTPLAMRRPSHTPTPPPWGSDRLLGYEWLVQPVLDRHCVRCHDPAKSDKADGQLDLTDKRADDGLHQSFRTLMGFKAGEKKPGRPLVACADRFSGAEVSEPRQFGSSQSPMIRVLLDDELHKKEVELDPNEWLSLVTWIDANAPYHDAFFNKRPAGGGEPVRNVPPRPLPSLGPKPDISAAR